MVERLVSSFAEEAAESPDPVPVLVPAASMPDLWTIAAGHGIHRLPPGPLGDALRRLTPVQRAVAAAEILGPPLAMRSKPINSEPSAR